jgi:hypothetical protein
VLIAGTESAVSGTAKRVTHARSPETKWVVADEWPRLVGTEVDIRRKGRLVRRGVVDNATLDGTMVWVAQHGVEERRLVDKSDGYELWIAPSDIRRLFGELP